MSVHKTPTSSDATSPALKGSVAGERALFAANSPDDLDRVCHKLWRAFVAAEAEKTKLSEDVEKLRRQQELAIREIRQKAKSDREKLARVLASAAIKRARQELDSDRLHQRMELQRKKREFQQDKRDELQRLKIERQAVERERAQQAEELKQQQETLNRQQEQWGTFQKNETAKREHEKGSHTAFMQKTQAELESQRCRQADELEQRRREVEQQLREERLRFEAEQAQQADELEQKKRVAEQKLREERLEFQAAQERQAAELEQRRREVEQELRNEQLQLELAQKRQADDLEQRKQQFEQQLQEQQLRIDTEQARLEEEQSRRQQAFRMRFRMVEEVLRKLGLRHDRANNRVHSSGPHNNAKDSVHYPKDWRVG